MSASIRKCRRDELTAILAIVNAAAEAYRGVIPADRWHEPYMTRRELESEIAAGIAFWGYEADGPLIGVMGIQAVGDVELIRHAYVLPGSQPRGVGGALLEHLSARSERRMLVGTWAAAEWAIDFYRRRGFALASPERGTALLKRYWTIPDRRSRPRWYSPARPSARSEAEVRLLGRASSRTGGARRGGARPRDARRRR